MFVVGVSGRGSGWTVVALENGSFAGATSVSTFGQVLEVAEEAACVAVDLPLGLVDRGERDCDILLREFLGPSRSGVLVAAPRPALLAPTYAEANAECLRRAGFRMTKRLWSLKPKILEIEKTLRNREEAAVDVEPRSAAPSSTVKGREPRKRLDFVQRGRDLSEPSALRRFARVVVPDRRGSLPPTTGPRIIEVNPEACFRELAGEPIPTARKSYDGTMTRLASLSAAGIVMPSRLSIGKVDIEGVLDAAVAAWTSNRHARGLSRCFPKADRHRQQDGDRAVAIWV